MTTTTTPVITPHTTPGVTPADRIGETAGAERRVTEHVDLAVTGGVSAETTKGSGRAHQTVWLDPACLAVHPRNVRDDLGDPSGLAASIAAQGVHEALNRDSAEHRGRSPGVPSGCRAPARRRRHPRRGAGGPVRGPPRSLRRRDSRRRRPGHPGRARRGDARREPAPPRPLSGGGGARRAGHARPRRHAEHGRPLYGAGPQAGRQGRRGRAPRRRHGRRRQQGRADPGPGRGRRRLRRRPRHHGGVDRGGRGGDRTVRPRADPGQARPGGSTASRGAVGGVGRRRAPPSRRGRRLPARPDQLPGARRAAADRRGSRHLHGLGGLRHHWLERPQMAGVCAAPATYGHTSRWIDTRLSGSGGEPTEPDREAAAAAERREVIENNKAMAAANETRRVWPKELLQRRTAPRPDCGSPSGPSLPTRTRCPGGCPGSPTEPKIRPRPTSGSSPPVSGRPPGRGPRRHLPAANSSRTVGWRWRCSLESTLDRSSWRDPSAGAARWLRFLAGVGYTLADIEQQIVDFADPRGRPATWRTTPTTWVQCPIAGSPNSAAAGCRPALSAGRGGTPPGNPWTLRAAYRGGRSGRSGVRPG